MTEQASIFIGSSTESLDYANALQHVLDHDLLTTVWTYGVFLPGRGTLASLLARARSTDFAALFLSPDDEARVRGQYLRTPRDNLVFELGLFIGKIGPERTFLLTPRANVELPSDLQGITPIKYRTDREDGDVLNAVNPAATEIRIAATKMGPRQGEQPEIAGSPSGAAPSVLSSIGALGAVAAKIGAALEVQPAEGGKFEIVFVDPTRLGASVKVDLADSASAEVIDRFGESLRVKYA